MTEVGNKWHIPYSLFTQIATVCKKLGQNSVFIFYINDFIDFELKYSVFLHKGLY